MSRELKFRAYDKRENRYRRISSLNFDDGKLVSVSVCDPGDSEPTILPPEQVVLEQSTCLFDINGVEMFEGDLMRGHYKTRPEEWYFGQIAWNDGGFLLCSKGDIRDGRILGGWEFWTTYTNKCCKVVGNIHENPELLEKNGGVA